MSELPIELKGTIESLKSAEELWLTGATIQEAFGEITEMTVEFVTKGPITMKDLVGQNMSIKMEAEGGFRYFGGVCTSVERVGEKQMEDGVDVGYVAEIRPWLWMLTRASNNRIFQEKTVVQIIEEVFGDHGFADFQKKLNATYEERLYCVQFGETDYAFISRLMEEEGIYHFWDNSANDSAISKLILCDDKSSSHVNTPGMSTIKFTGSGGAGINLDHSVTDWTSAENVIPGKVTLNDYDMLTPTVSHQVVTETIAVMDHSHKTYELYQYPANYRKDTARGNRLAEVLMEAQETDFMVRHGATTSRNLAIGHKFTLEDAPEGEDGDYLVIAATHYIRPSISQRQDHNQLIRDRRNLQYPEEMEGMDYQCRFKAISTEIQYRSKCKTPWPSMTGIHSAHVVGPSGEEIYTDEHGRIKVQFPWDRVGQNDENSTCWIRVATPWSGKDWGMVAIPRIDQEVIVQFENGNPDRPVVTGMLWNEDTKPAFPYPDKPTELGIRTNSSKGGGGYNELMFDDLKDEELMRVQAQKDHQFLIKNKSVVTIGLDEIDAGAHDEDGSLSEVIRNHVTRTIKEGDHYFTMEEGNEEYIIDTGTQTIEIEGDKTETIRTGNHIHTVQTGNMETTVETGNHETTIDTGNMTTTVSTGHHETTVSTGNHTLDISTGKSETEALQSIEFKVGSNSIKIDQMGVTIKGMMIKIEGTAMAEMKSPMTTVKGDGMLTLKGGITMIN
ncbi:MAG: type VI secretion system Vgr family protein [Arenibacterium sp.]